MVLEHEEGRDVALQEGDRLSVQAERLPVAPSWDEEARLSILSPARQRRVFDGGAWYPVDSANPQKEPKR